MSRFLCKNVNNYVSSFKVLQARDAQAHHTMRDWDEMSFQEDFEELFLEDWRGEYLYKDEEDVPIRILKTTQNNAHISSMMCV